MVQPIRPQDASGIYRQQAAASSRAAGAGSTPGADGTRGAGRSGRRTDQVHISTEAQDFRRALEAVSNQPEVRETRVAELRSQIANGTYTVDARAIAARLVQEGRIG